MAQHEPASPAKLRIPASLNRALSQSSLRRKSAYLQEIITRQHHHKGYDREYKDALLSGEVGNGVRTWYSSFTTIGELTLSGQRVSGCHHAQGQGAAAGTYAQGLGSLLTTSSHNYAYTSLNPPSSSQTGSTTNAKRTGASPSSDRVEASEVS